MIATIGRWLPTSAFTRRLVVLSTGTILAQAIVIVVIPILTRIYDPRSFGIYAAFASLFGILSVGSALGYDLAIPLAASSREAVALVWLSVLSAFATAALVLVLLWSAAGLLGWLGDVGATPQLLQWLGLGMLLCGFKIAFDGWITYRGALRIMVARRIGQAAAMAGLQLGLGLTFGGPAALVAGLVLSYVVDCLVMVVGMGAADRQLLRPPSLHELATYARRHWRFPLISLPSTLLDAAGSMLPALLFTVVYGPATAGFYNLAQRIVGVPLRLLGSSASQLFKSEIARLARTQPQALFTLFLVTSRRFLVFGLLYLGPLAILGPLVFKIAFGAAWEPSGAMIWLLLPMYLVMLANHPTRSTLLLFNRQARVFVLNLLIVLGLTTSVALGWALDLGVAPTILLASCCAAAVYANFWLTTFRLLRGLARGEKLESMVADG
jgi:O-antigen/teichoic acid export membrane protein